MLLFHWTEQWTFVEALYFTFVSLATIGFGDYVSLACLTTHLIGVL
jgi:Ion channel